MTDFPSYQTERIYHPHLKDTFKDVPRSQVEKWKAAGWITGEAPVIVDADAPTVDPDYVRPAKNASVEVWRDYAVAIGADPEVVADMPRSELIDQYGPQDPH